MSGIGRYQDVGCHTRHLISILDIGYEIVASVPFCLKQHPRAYIYTPAAQGGSLMWAYVYAYGAKKVKVIYMELKGWLLQSLYMGQFLFNFK